VTDEIFDFYINKGIFPQKIQDLDRKPTRKFSSQDQKPWASLGIRII